MLNKFLSPNFEYNADASVAILQESGLELRVELESINGEHYLSLAYNDDLPLHSSSPVDNSLDAQAELTVLIETGEQLGLQIPDTYPTIFMPIEDVRDSGTEKWHKTSGLTGTLHDPVPPLKRLLDWTGIPKNEPFVVDSRLIEFSKITYDNIGDFVFYDSTVVGNIEETVGIGKNSEKKYKTLNIDRCVRKRNGEVVSSIRVKVSNVPGAKPVIKYGLASTEYSIYSDSKALIGASESDVKFIKDIVENGAVVEAAVAGSLLSFIKGNDKATRGKYNWLRYLDHAFDPSEKNVIETTVFDSESDDTLKSLLASAYFSITGVYPNQSNITVEEKGPPLKADIIDNREIVNSEFMDGEIFSEIVDEFEHLFHNPKETGAMRSVFADVKGQEYLSAEESKAKVQEWIRNARSQYQSSKVRSENSGKVIVSLFDRTGNWSRPYEEAGYTVLRFDIQDGYDILEFTAEYLIEKLNIEQYGSVYGVLSATPCTDFANCGSKHWEAKDARGDTAVSRELVYQTIRVVDLLRPKFWCMENPVGRIEKETGLPKYRLSFNPNHFGADYTKHTLLWGKFETNLPVANSDPVLGSKMHTQYGGKSLATKNARSETPIGFSYAFFAANNYHDLSPEKKLEYDFIQYGNVGVNALKAGVPEKIVRKLFSHFDAEDSFEEVSKVLAVISRIQKSGDSLAEIDGVIDEALSWASPDIDRVLSNIREIMTATIDIEDTLGQIGVRQDNPHFTQLDVFETEDSFEKAEQLIEDHKAFITSRVMTASEDAPAIFKNESGSQIYTVTKLAGVEHRWKVTTWSAVTTPREETFSEASEVASKFVEQFVFTSNESELNPLVRRMIETAASVADEKNALHEKIQTTEPTTPQYKTEDMPWSGVGVLNRNDFFGTIFNAKTIDGLEIENGFINSIDTNGAIYWQNTVGEELSTQVLDPKNIEHLEVVTLCEFKEAGKKILNKGEPWRIKSNAESALKKLGLEETHYVDGYGNEGASGREYWLEPKPTPSAEDFNINMPDLQMVDDTTKQVFYLNNQSKSNAEMLRNVTKHYDFIDIRKVDGADGNGQEYALVLSEGDSDRLSELFRKNAMSPEQAATGERAVRAQYNRMVAIRGAGHNHYPMTVMFGGVSREVVVSPGRAPGYNKQRLGYQTPLNIYALKGGRLVADGPVQLLAEPYYLNGKNLLTSKASFAVTSESELFKTFLNAGFSIPVQPTSGVTEILPRQLPEVATTLSVVADSWEQLRKIDVHRLLNVAAEESNNYALDVFRELALQRPDLEVEGRESLADLEVSVEESVTSPELRKETAEPTTKIADTGYLAGSRKEKFAENAYIRSLENGEDFSSLGKAIPTPDVARLIEEGFSPKAVSLALCLKEMVGRRPTGRHGKRLIPAWEDHVRATKKVIIQVLNPQTFDEVWRELKASPQFEVKRNKSPEKKVEYIASIPAEHMVRASQIVSIEVIQTMPGVGDMYQLELDDSSVNYNLYSANPQLVDNRFHESIDAMSKATAHCLAAAIDKVKTEKALKRGKIDIGIYSRDVPERAHAAGYESGGRFIPVEPVPEDHEGSLEDWLQTVRDKVTQYTDQEPVIGEYDKQVSVYFAGFKPSGGSVQIVQELPEDLQHARKTKMAEWLEENLSRLQQKVQDVRSTKIRKEDMQPRSGGRDYRKGRNVTPEQLKAEFGLKVVQFGNSTLAGQKQAQIRLNEAYDGFHDLANVLGISPRSIGLGGGLSLSFGARGRGGKPKSGLATNAHYEPIHIVINLTKERGSGSLSHEWWHAFDNYVKKLEDNTPEAAAAKPGPGYATAGDAAGEIRSALKEAFSNIRKAIASSEYQEASGLVDGMVGNKDAYWSDPKEMSARAFEAYVKHELFAKGMTNDFLTGVISPTNGLDSVVPSLEGLAKFGFAEAFDKLFESVLVKHGETGDYLYKLDTEGAPIAYRAQKAERVREWVSKVTSDTGVAIRVVADKFELPKSLAIALPDNAAGIYDLGTGIPYVIADRVRNQDHAIKTALHEGLGHAGVLEFLQRNADAGGKQVEEVLDEIYEGVGAKEIQRAVRGYAINYHVASGRREAVLEYIAHLAETGRKPDLIAKAVYPTLDLVENLYGTVGWGRSDVVSLIEASRVYSLRMAVEKAGLGNLTAEERREARSQVIQAALASSGGNIKRLLAGGQAMVAFHVPEDYAGAITVPQLTEADGVKFYSNTNKLPGGAAQPGIISRVAATHLAKADIALSEQSAQIKESLASIGLYDAKLDKVYSNWIAGKPRMETYPGDMAKDAYATGKRTGADLVMLVAERMKSSRGDAVKLLNNSGIYGIQYKSGPIAHTCLFDKTLTEKVLVGSDLQTRDNRLLNQGWLASLSAGTENPLTKHESELAVAKAWLEVASEPTSDLHRYLTASGKSMPEIFESIGYQIAEDKTVLKKMNQLGGDNPTIAGIEHVWLITSPEADTSSFIYEADDRVWLDVSELKSGAGMGSEIYQAVADFCANTGKIFIGDPEGLTEVAVLRRTEQMFSSALRHKTTDHIAPHLNQLEAINDAGQRIPNVTPLSWDDSELEKRLASMIRTSYTNVLNQIPELCHVEYDFERSQYRAIGQSAESGSVAGRLARHINENPVGFGWMGLQEAIGREISPMARAVASSATVKRTVLTNSLIRIHQQSARGHEVPANVTELLSRASAASDLSNILYRRGLELPDSGHTVSTVKDWVASVEKYTSTDVRVVSSKDQLPARLRNGLTSDVAGIYDGRARIPYLIANRIRDEEHAVKTALHEGLGHAGIIHYLKRTQAIGGQAVDQVLEDIYQSLSGEMAEIISDYGLDVETPEGRTEAVLEYLAYQSEQSDVKSDFDKAMIHLLDQAHGDLNWSREDVANLIEASRLFMAIERNVVGKTSDLQHSYDSLMAANGRRLEKLLNKNRKQVAWHGSPFRFNEFSVDNINSGEGAQAYGYGLYFADREGVGRFYERALAREVNIVSNAGQEIGRYHDVELKYNVQAGASERAVELYLESDKNWDRAAASAIELQESDDVKAEIERLQNHIIPASRGSVYRVELDCDPEDFLDFDLAISDQSEKVKQFLNKHRVLLGFNQSMEEMQPAWKSRYLAEVRANGFTDVLVIEELSKAIDTISFTDEMDSAAWGVINRYPSTTMDPNDLHDMRELAGTGPNGVIYRGEDAYYDLINSGLAEDEVKASALLAEQGIVGIRYYSGPSRIGINAVEDFNHVVFDDRHVKVISRDNAAANEAQKKIRKKLKITPDVPVKEVSLKSALYWERTLIEQSDTVMRGISVLADRYRVDLAELSTGGDVFRELLRKPWVAGPDGLAQTFLTVGIDGIVLDAGDNEKQQRINHEIRFADALSVQDQVLDSVDRKRQAEQLGFDVNTVYLHGSHTGAIDGFNPGNIVHYFTPNPDYGYIQKSTSVYPVYLKMKAPYYADSVSEVEQARNNPERVQELKEQGFDAIVWQHPNNPMRGATGWGDDRAQVAVFDASQIRSVHAEFDPEFAASSNIMMRKESHDAFRQWFGDSKTVNRDGTVQVFYHGTYDRFETFTPSTSGSLGSGIYFYNRREHTETFGDKIVEVNLAIQNPWYTTADWDSPLIEEWDFDSPTIEAILSLPGGKELVEEARAGDGHYGQKLQSLLVDLGYDGVIATHPDGVEEVVVFNPNQVKSAYENNGEYGITDNIFHRKENPDFDAVLSESKVRDSEGEPLLVYHGTRGPVEKLDVIHGDDGGLWFTPEKDHAEIFTTTGIDGGVHEVYLNLVNPMTVTSEQLEAEWDKEHPDGEQDDRYLLPRDYADRFVARAKEQGYDGLIVEGLCDHDFDTDLYIAFSNDQILSVKTPENAIPHIKQINEQNFDEWFAGSQLVTDTNEPMVVYANSGERLDEYTSFAVGPESLMLRAGESASSYVLAAKNIADLTDINSDAYQSVVKYFNESGGWEFEEDGRTDFDPEVDTVDEIYECGEYDTQAYLEEQGYDAVKIDILSSVYYQVFNKDQICSADVVCHNVQVNQQPDINAIDFDTTWYHGSTLDIDGQLRAQNNNSLFGRGVYLTSNQEDAARYASTDPEINIDLGDKAYVMHRELGIDYSEAKAALLENGGHIVPVHAKHGKTLTLDNRGITLNGLPIATEDIQSDVSLFGSTLAFSDIQDKAQFRDHLLVILSNAKNSERHNLVRNLTGNFESSRSKALMALIRRDNAGDFLRSFAISMNASFIELRDDMVPAAQSGARHLISIYGGEDLVSAIEVRKHHPINRRVSSLQSSMAVIGNTKVVNEYGEPVIVYRGQHRGDAGPEFLESTVASFSFGDADIATAYAERPNYGDKFYWGKAPAVMPAYLKIENPFVNYGCHSNSSCEPFIDISTAIARLNLTQEEAFELARFGSEGIQNTNNWEEISEEFDVHSIDELIEQHPEKVPDLFFEIFYMLDDHRWVNRIKEAGYDGAIYGGSGENEAEAEYRIFDQSQAIPAIHHPAVARYRSAIRDNSAAVNLLNAVTKGYWAIIPREDQIEIRNEIAELSITFEMPKAETDHAKDLSEIRITDISERGPYANDSFWSSQFSGVFTRIKEAGFDVITVATPVKADYLLQALDASGFKPAAGNNSDLVLPITERAKEIVRVSERAPRFMFVGTRSLNIDYNDYMSAFLDAKDTGEYLRVWQETGWFKGVDNHWRYEISDHNASLDENFIRRHFDTVDKKGWATLELSHALNHQQLFEHYPELYSKGIMVLRKSNDGGASYYQDKDLHIIEINVNPKLDLNFDAVLSSVLHEVQHAIQNIEGFAYGSNPDFAPAVKEIYRARNDDQQDKLKPFREKLEKEQSEAQFYGRMVAIKEWLRDAANPEATRKASQIYNSQAYGMRATEIIRELGLAPNKRKRYEHNVYLNNVSKFLAHKLAVEFENEYGKNVHDEIASIEKTGGDVYRLHRNATNRYGRAHAKYHNELESLRIDHADAFKAVQHESDFDVYWRSAGEVEARNTQTRKELTDFERRDYHPYESQDFSNSSQFVFKQEEQAAAHAVVAKYAQGVAERQGIETPINVVAQQSDLPPVIQREAALSKSPVAGAFYDGQMYVVAESMDSPLAVESTLLHEAAHAGVETIFGNEMNDSYGAMWVALGEKQGMIKAARAFGIDMKPYIDMATDRIQEGIITQEQYIAMLVDEFVAHASFGGHYADSSVSTRDSIREYFESTRTVAEKTGLNGMALAKASDISAVLKAVNEAARGTTPENKPNIVIKDSEPAKKYRWQKEFTARVQEKHGATNYDIVQLMENNRITLSKAYHAGFSAKQLADTEPFIEMLLDTTPFGPKGVYVRPIKPVLDIERENEEGPNPKPF